MISFSHLKLSLGLAILLFVSMTGPIKGTDFAHGGVNLVLPPAFNLLPGPVLQSTSYPAPTQGPTSGYPAQVTATTGSGYPGPQTTTPPQGGSPTPVVTQNGTLATQAPPALVTLTLSLAATAGNDIFLTENAEMGQSQATRLPTETPSPSATLTVTLTLTQTPTPIPPVDGFQMNWGVFLAAFFGVIVIGGAAWLTFLRRFLGPKV